MSGASSSAAGWSTLLEPAGPPTDLVRRPDDPRLGEIVEFWNGDPAALWPGRAVLVGFPQDEGVRRNGGRVGAAEAPREIRQALWRLSNGHVGRSVDLGEYPPLDIGNLRVTDDLEKSQEWLGRVIAHLLSQGAVPMVLGGGHETAFGHYLGYVKAGKEVTVINVDAHLDVRPLRDGLAHSGSPFRQMMEYPQRPLTGKHYSCLGVQPQATAKAHWDYCIERGCRLRLAQEIGHALDAALSHELDQLRRTASSLYLSIDADAFHTADVPGVSAPNATGIPGSEMMNAAQLAGRSFQVTSFDLVEINPRYDRDGQSARWAALVVWNFLIGLAQRQHASAKRR